MNTLSATHASGATRGAARQYKLWVWIGCALAVPIGLKWGFDFGHQLNGLWLGLLTAGNTALLCGLLVDGVVSALADRLPNGRV